MMSRVAKIGVTQYLHLIPERSFMATLWANCSCERYFRQELGRREQEYQTVDLVRALSVQLSVYLDRPFAYLGIHTSSAACACLVPVVQCFMKNQFLTWRNTKKNITLEHHFPTVELFIVLERMNPVLSF